MTAALSIVMPVYNGARFLGEAIESLLGQGVPGLEIVVVDDGSTDGSGTIAAGFGAPVRCLGQENRGPAAARNAGIAAAGGAVVGFLDADDLWVADRLGDHLALLHGASGAGGVRGSLRYLRERDGVWAPCGPPLRALNLSGALFHRSALETVGPLDASLRTCEDIDWYVRAQRAGVAIEQSEEVFWLYRRHGANTTCDVERVRRDTLRVVARHGAAALRAREAVR